MYGTTWVYESIVSTVNFMKFKFRSSISNKNFSIQTDMCSKHNKKNEFQRLTRKNIKISMTFISNVKKIYWLYCVKIN